MPEKWTIKAGDHITLYDGLEEWRKIYEGDVLALEEVPGSEAKRFVCDPPFWIERLRGGDDQD